MNDEPLDMSDIPGNPDNLHIPDKALNELFLAALARYEESSFNTAELLVRRAACAEIRRRFALFAEYEAECLRLTCLFAKVCDYATGGLLTKSNYEDHVYRNAIDDHLGKLVDDRMKDIQKAGREGEGK
jgi:hypothetical protein